MVRSVVVGLDGSAESRAAAEWAAREAKRRFLPLELVHVWEAVPAPMALAPLLGVPPADGRGSILREAAEEVRLRHPGLDVIVDQVPGRPAEVLTKAAKDAALMVLGSRGLGGIGGFLVGSVGQAVVAQAEQPVVLVRAGERLADGHATDPSAVPFAGTPFGPVVLGLDTDSPDDAVITFAFEAAARRVTPCGSSTPGACRRTSRTVCPPTPNSTPCWQSRTLPRWPRCCTAGRRSTRPSRSSRSPAPAVPPCTWSTPRGRHPWSSWADGSAEARSVHTSAPSRTPSCITPQPPSPSSRTTDTGPRRCPPVCRRKCRSTRWWGGPAPGRSCPGDPSRQPGDARGPRTRRRGCRRHRNRPRPCASLRGGAGRGVPPAGVRAWRCPAHRTTGRPLPVGKPA